jgi:molybdenum cofactor sulfurtransferase
MESFAADMMSELYGNPHSEHAPSKLADVRVEATREKALRFFNADPKEWDLVFVANATAAIKIVHDCFRDHAIEKRQNWWYGYHKDAHTSVVGVREGTRTHRCFRNDREVELWIESRGLGGAQANDLALFAYPGQSNMTGRRLPLDW